MLTKHPLQRSELDDVYVYNDSLCNVVSVYSASLCNVVCGSHTMIDYWVYPNVIFG